MGDKSPKSKQKNKNQKQKNQKSEAAKKSDSATGKKIDEIFKTTKKDSKKK